MIVRGARIVLGLALLAGSVAAPAGGVDGMEFPNQAPSSDGQGHLMLAGSATLQRNFVPFYGAALYVPASVRSVEQLLGGLSPCRIQLVWLTPEMDSDAVREYWRKALEAAAGDEQAGRVHGQIERLVQAMPAAQRGQRLVFDYVPDAGMKVLVDDRPLVQLAGVEFNRSVLAVWLGATAPADFRAALVARLGQR